MLATVVGIVVGLGAACGVGRDALADQYLWTGAVDANWHNAVNWVLLSGSDPGPPNDADDTAIFSIASLNNAVLTTSLSIKALAIGGAFIGVVTLSGGGVTLLVVGDDNDLDALLGLLALPSNQAVVISGGTLRVTSGAVLVGLDGARELFQIWHTAMPDLFLGIQQVLASGDHVVVRFRATGTHKGPLMGIPATGRQVEFQAAVVHELAQGKHRHAWMYWDNATILRQLGIMGAG